MKNTSTGKELYFGKDLEAMSFAIKYHEWIMAEFQDYLGNNVAEVGAGIGDFSKLILNTNIETLTAFEPSKNMYPILAAALRNDSRAEAVNDFFGAEEKGRAFDSVLYVNVLEHIADDCAELVKAYKLLKQGGYLLVFVPALSWLYSDLDKQVGHYRRYSKKGLIEIAQRAGFNLATARYFDIAGIIPWYINFVVLKNSITVGSVSLYDNIVVPPMRKIEGLVTPPIGKNILLVAQKA